MLLTLCFHGPQLPPQFAPGAAVASVVAANSEAEASMVVKERMADSGMEVVVVVAIVWSVYVQNERCC